MTKKTFYKFIPPLSMLVLAVVFLFAKAPQAHASLFGVSDIASLVIAKIIEFIQLLIVTILGLFLWIVSLLLDFTLSLGQFSKAGIVTIGWNLTLGIANMLFVVVIIIIAFATVLHIEKYKMEELLPKLIITALLVNFSLVLGGFIIDFTQVTAKFFAEKSGSGKGVGITQTMIDKLGVANILGPPTEFKYNADSPTALTPEEQAKQDAAIKEALKNEVLPVAMTDTSGFGAYFAAQNVVKANSPKTAEAGATSALINLFASIVIMISLVFVIGAGAFFMIVRIVMLWILLIFAPLAWASRILPDTSDMWGKWWNSFLKWSFFAPIYTFFIYLTSYALQTNAILGSFSNTDNQTALSNIANGMAEGIQGGQLKGGFFTEFFASPSLLILQYIVVIILLFGGLLFANSISAFGAKKITEWGSNKAKSFGKGTAKYAGSAASLAAQKSPKTQAAIKALEKMPVIGKMMGGAGAYLESQKKSIGEHKKKFENRSKDDLLSETHRTALTADDMYRRAAIMELLAEKGGLKDDTEDKKQGLSNIATNLPLMERYGVNMGKILNARPDWAHHTFESDGKTRKTADGVIKGLKPEEASNIQEEALETDEVNKAIGDHFIGAHYSNVASKSAKLKRKMQDKLNDSKIIPNEEAEAYMQKSATQATGGWSYPGMDSDMAKRENKSANPTAIPHA